ncbi:hypothetical protein AAFC00_002865 [Neodothiora populina]|uniref:Uncharacterized protein n=1 Tax=Neodothiora populina TaxID=2781224 RepID=A0ABR3P8H4_9PEZI
MELLVHTTAPSSKRDDDRYKRQAHAFSTFAAIETTSWQSEISTTSHADEVPPLGTSLNHCEIGVDNRVSPPVFLDDTQLARTALESQLVTSSLGPIYSIVGVNSESPQDAHSGGGSIRTPASCTRLILDPVRSSSSPCEQNSPSEMQTASIPSKIPAQANLSHLESTTEEEAITPSSSAHAEYAVASSLNPGNRRQPTSLLGARQSSSPADIPSQLPSTYSLSDTNSRCSPPFHDHRLSSPVNRTPSTPSRIIRQVASSVSSLPNQTLHDSTALPPYSGTSSRADPGPARTRPENHSFTTLETKVSPHAPNTSHADANVNAADAESNHELSVANRRRQSMQHLCPKLNITESVIAMPPPPRPVTKDRPSLRMPVTPAKPGGLEDIEKLPISIHPPPPPTSDETFTSHVTPALHALRSNSAISDRYKPKHVVRVPRQSERGYWLLDASTWSVGLQLQFWRFLIRHVGTGKSGWGVWCTRDVDNGMCVDTMRDKSASTSPGLGQIKIFCWGEVVQHVYLMLYVASKSKVRRVAPVWIDDEEQVVIQM